MLKIYYYLLAFFLVFGVAFAQPKLEIVGGDTYDWGDVNSNQESLNAKIKLKNTGNEKLVIKNVQPTCGCTTAPLDKNELEPGEYATLDVTLKPPKNSGPVNKAIRIETNIAKYEVATLNLKANVVFPIELLPAQYMRFQDMKVGEKSSSSITIKNNTNKTVNFSSIQVNPNFVDINLKKNFSLKPGEKTELKAWVTPKTEGYFNASIEMKTDSPDYKELKIRAYGNVQKSAVFNQ